MKPDQIEALRELITGQRMLTIAVAADGIPYAGLLPYAFSQEPLGLVVHVSRLARHSRGLSDGAAFAAVIHRPDDGSADALQIERVSLQGTAHLLTRGTPGHGAARELYLKRFPHGAVTFGLGDFELYHLEPEAGRYVTGFAASVNLNPSNLVELAAP